MNPSFVIDASVIISWFNHEEASVYSDRVLLSLSEHAAIIPVICCLEVNNVFTVLERKGKISSLDVDRILTYLNILPIFRDNTALSFEMPLVISLARKFSLSVYDACYLELALRLGLPLASLDKKLCLAASSVGVEIKNA